MSSLVSYKYELPFGLFRDRLERFDPDNEDLSLDDFKKISFNPTCVPGFIVAIFQWINDRICEWKYGSDVLLASKLSLALSNPNFTPPYITFNAETGISIKRKIGVALMHSLDGSTDYTPELAKFYAYVAKIEKRANAALESKGKIVFSKYEEVIPRKNIAPAFRLVNALDRSMQTIINANVPNNYRIRWFAPAFQVEEPAPVAAVAPAVVPKQALASSDPAFDALMASRPHESPIFRMMAEKHRAESARNT